METPSIQKALYFIGWIFLYITARVCFDFIIRAIFFLGIVLLLTLSNQKIFLIFQRVTYQLTHQFFTYTIPFLIQLGVDLTRE
jgi:hypothetical protein